MTEQQKRRFHAGIQRETQETVKNTKDMNLMKIAVLLLAGILILSFVLPIIAQTTTEARLAVANDEAAVNGEYPARQNAAAMQGHSALMLVG